MSYGKTGNRKYASWSCSKIWTTTEAKDGVGTEANTFKSQDGPFNILTGEAGQKQLDKLDLVKDQFQGGAGTSVQLG